MTEEQWHAHTMGLASSHGWRQYRRAGTTSGCLLLSARGRGIVAVVPKAGPTQVSVGQLDALAREAAAGAPVMVVRPANVSEFEDLLRRAGRSEERAG